MIGNASLSPSTILAGMQLCLLQIYPEPPPDYYQSGATLNEYQAEQEERAKMLFA